MVLDFKKITIIGVGLLGGSIASAVKAIDKDIEIIGVGRREENLQKALSLGIINRYEINPEKAVSESDLIILCTPVMTIPEIVKQIEPFTKKNVIITDVGSSKSYIVNTIEKINSKNILFVGSHPMAGLEKTGVENSKPDLYVNSVCFVTKTKNTNHQALNKIKNFWTLMGAQIVETSPDAHDNIVALTSHLPHILAALLANLVNEEEKKEENIKFGIANGFKDTTRIAASDPDMWKDICISNKKYILKKINDLRLELFKMETLITLDDFDGLYKKFLSAKTFREKL